jgi:hypothetical protein
MTRNTCIKKSTFLPKSRFVIEKDEVYLQYDSPVYVVVQVDIEGKFIKVLSSTINYLLC